MVSKKKKKSAAAAPVPVPVAVPLPLSGIAVAVASMSYPELLTRKDDISDRLQAIATEEPTTTAESSSSKKKKVAPKRPPPRATVASAQRGNRHLPEEEEEGPWVVVKTDVHWDYVAKEMMWLAADFAAERKRQMSLAKKLAAAVRQYHRTKESRKLRETLEKDAKRRRVASKIARDTKQWWHKIDRVIAYKQKVDADTYRRKSMDRHLVFLVRQTEKYGERLVSHQQQQQPQTNHPTTPHHNNNDVPTNSSDEENDHTEDVHKMMRSNKKRPMTIEEALAADAASSLRGRRAKRKTIDYRRMMMIVEETSQEEEEEFYGESTDGSVTDDDYEPEDAVDDETTLLQAEQEDAQQNHVVAMEIAKLNEEQDMDIQQVLDRFHQEGTDAQGENDTEGESLSAQEDDNSTTSKKVTFAPTPVLRKRPPRSSQNGETSVSSQTATNASTAAATAAATATANSTGSDADDDGDASDVEDFFHEDRTNSSNNEDNDDDGSEEFEADQTEIDDETTLEAEERLGREMSREEEINMLQRESEMSLEELRALYAPRNQEEEDENGDDDTDEDNTDNATADQVDKSSSGPSNVNENGSRVAATGEESSETKSLLRQKQEAGLSSASEEQTNSGNHAPDASSTDVAATTRVTRAKPLAASTSSASGEVKASLPSIFEEDDAEDEFHPDAAVPVDDETTLEAEEQFGRDMSYEEEMALLQRENEMPIDELRAMYANMNQTATALQDDSDTDDDDILDDAQNKSLLGQNPLLANTVQLLNEDDNGEDDDFEISPDAATEVDDETTMEVEEKLGRELSYEQELDILKKESEMSIEELRAMYANIDDDDSENEVDHEEKDDTPESLAAVADMFHADDNADEDEFQPDTKGEPVDDETTLEAEERLSSEMGHEEEISMLQRESETPMEELRAMYASMVQQHDESESTSSSGEEPESSGEKRKHQDESTQTLKKRRVVASSKGDNTNNDDAGTDLMSLEASDQMARQTAVTRPFLLANWVKLREYQQVGLNWLVSSQTRRLNGILADEMGLGKTLQTISLLAYLAAYKGIWGPHLIIVPTSCIVNWEVELKRFFPGFKTLCYYGSAKRRKELRSGWTKSNWHHVVVTSYQLAVQDAFAFKRKKWYYLILDEAQNIKNFQSQRWQTLVNFNTQRRLLLTGTPLQNNLMELWSLLHFLMPHVFRSRKEFSYWFSNPMNNIIEGNTSRNDDLIGRLHGIIRPFVLRRLKKDVETQMPGKYEHIVKCQLSRRQMFLYEEFMARSSTRVALNKGGNFMGMMNVLMQLRKVCNHPDLFEARSVITPFVTDPLAITTAACVIGITDHQLPLDSVGKYLLHPLWSCGTGMPSYSSSCRHDSIEEKQLKNLQTKKTSFVGRLLDDDIAECKGEDEINPGLKAMLSNIWDNSKHERTLTAERHAHINALRCESPSFAYSERLLTAVEMNSFPMELPEMERMSAVDIAQTPTDLLGMRRSQQERADDMDDMMKKFVFCVPKAGARTPDLKACKIDHNALAREHHLASMISEPLDSFYLPFRKANARLTSFFPDKKLIQFDAGKLQALAELLRERKRDGHKVLIFTQMSKMLDILEAFLNLNGHTYLRLDGGTGVEKRQRLMDRFNNDDKVFCFILSTRSGGLGINLTGADTVVFYDSDWNPAMDAQAQDRAHRIGQTRDVHIYRLVTEHSIEENILIKAKQKRHLDFLVMDEGKFHTVEAPSAGTQIPNDDATGEDAAPDLFSKGGLLDILGVKKDGEGETKATEEKGNSENECTEIEPSKEQMEKAMASLEDEDDVLAMRGAQKEAAEELQEFDESIQLKKDDDKEDSESGDDKHATKKKKAVEKAAKIDKPTANTTVGNPAANGDEPVEATEEEMEKEFAAWQKEVGMDAGTIESSLKPMERYALRFRETIDPFFSMWYLSDEQKQYAAASMEEEWNVEEIELSKAVAEQRAMEEGDLLASFPPTEMLPRQKQLYIREKSRLRANKKRRKLTGENWVTKVDGVSQLPFWYNEDTGEAIWDKPAVLNELASHETALEKKWIAMPLEPLRRIMDFLLPYPDRVKCSTVCKHWKAAATDISFVRHVIPVEMGALALEDSKLDHNHYRSIADVLTIALPGDTIEFSDGHYWVKEPGIKVDFPLRFIGHETDPTHVVIELSGLIDWHGARGGWMEGITIRRPKIAASESSSHEILQVQKGGKLDMVHCVLDNGGCSGSVVRVNDKDSHCRWDDVAIRGSGSAEGAVVVDSEGGLELSKCRITDNQGNGIKCMGGSVIRIEKSEIERNGGIGLILEGSSRCEVLHDNRFSANRFGLMKKEDRACPVVSSKGNTCDVPSPEEGPSLMRGFRVGAMDSDVYVDDEEMISNEATHGSLQSNKTHIPELVPSAVSVI